MTKKTICASTYVCMRLHSAMLRLVVGANIYRCVLYAVSNTLLLNQVMLSLLPICVHGYTDMYNDLRFLLLCFS